MDPDVYFTRPKKRRRRTKGGRPLREDDPDAADGVAMSSVIHNTETGPVEEIVAIPIWLDQPEPSQPRSRSDNSHSPLPDNNQPSLAHHGVDNHHMEDQFQMEDQPSVTRPSKVI